MGNNSFFLVCISNINAPASFLFQLYLSPSSKVWTKSTVPLLECRWLDAMIWAERRWERKSLFDQEWTGVEKILKIVLFCFVFFLGGERGGARDRGKVRALVKTQIDKHREMEPYRATCCPCTCSCPSSQSAKWPARWRRRRKWAQTRKWMPRPWRPRRERLSSDKPSSRKPSKRRRTRKWRTKCCWIVHESRRLSLTLYECCLWGTKLSLIRQIHASKEKKTSPKQVKSRGRLGRGDAIVLQNNSATVTYIATLEWPSKL